MDLSANEEEMPIPITSSYDGGSHGPRHNTNSIIHCDSLPLQHLHPSNGPPLPSLPLHSPTPLSSAAPFISKKGMVVKYRECLKNHAASIGGNATDGCGEFMPSGDEGTLEALKCSACNCHRNFHRKEIAEDPYFSCDCLNFEGGRKLMVQKGVLISGAADPFGYNPRPSHQMIMPLCSMQTLESDEMEGVGGVIARPLMVKKRFRTKFTPEQKEKMLGFAEKVGWRLQKQEDTLVQQICQEIGVKRSVLKVWMHNNKHNFAKKTSILQLE